MFIDTHCHIHDPEYHFDPEETLAKAHYAGVQKIIVIGTSPRDSEVARAFAEAYDGVYYSYGYHPGELTAGEDAISSFSERVTSPPQNHNVHSLERVGSPACQVRSSENETECCGFDTARSRGSENEEIASSASKLVAIGEIGLDYHYKPFNRERQIALLEQMLELAKKQDLPAIFHVREAYQDFWSVVDNSGIKHAVLHSFSDTQENLNKALDRGFLIGVNGLATFADIPLPPLESIVLETDAPYLTPSPFRGKMNEPAYIPEIARFLAQHFGVTLEEIAEVTTKNAERFFRI